MPDMRRSPITKEGYAALREELERLKKHERPKIIAAIEEARGHGDLSENAEYIYAKERQAFVEARMQDLENKLGNSEIIDTNKLPADRIVFGSTFILCNVETEEEIRYQIVGVDESDLKKGKISVESPMAKALIGKRISDDVIVDTPNGKREYEILEIMRD
jgi:transcription elongation factor GreA